MAHVVGSNGQLGPVESGLIWLELVCTGSARIVQDEMLMDRHLKKESRVFFSMVKLIGEEANLDRVHPRGIFFLSSFVDF